jgi:hypothetical protein
MRVSSPAIDGWRQPAGWLLALALLALIVFGYLMPLTGYFTLVPGSPANARHNSVVLEHLYRVLTGSAELWNPAYYYPYKGALAFSDNHFGSAATYVLARSLGLSREHAFDLWFVAGTLLNFPSALYVLRRLGLGVAAAALGAFFYTAAVPVPSQVEHAQLVHRFAAPLAVLALWQMLERRRLADLGRLAFFTVWQFYCSIYLGLFLAYLLVALTVGILLIGRTPDWPAWHANLRAERWPAGLAAGGLLLAAVLAFVYLVGHYFSISRAYNLEHWRSVDVISRMLPRPGSYLIADGSPLLAWLGRGVSVPQREEHQMFIGFGAIAMIVAATLAAWRGRAAVGGLTQPMLIALALMVLGTLCVEHLSFYYLIAWLPGIDGIRAVSRIILIMLLPMSVLVALGAEAVWQRLGRTLPSAAAVLAGLAALLAVEPLSVFAGATPITQWQGRLEAVKARLPSAVPKDAVLLVRTGSRDVEEQINAEVDAMLLGQDLGYPALNGYSAFYPPGYRLRRCASAIGRLMGYSYAMGGTDISAHARRLVVVDLDAACPRGEP